MVQFVPSVSHMMNKMLVFREMQRNSTLVSVLFPSREEFGKFNAAFSPNHLLTCKYIPILLYYYHLDSDPFF